MTLPVSPDVRDGYDLPEGAGPGVHELHAVHGVEVGVHEVQKIALRVFEYGPLVLCPILHQDSLATCK